MASIFIAANSGAFACRFCRATTKSPGFVRLAAATRDRLVVSLSVPATNPTASARFARGHHVGLGRVADDDPGLLGGGLRRCRGRRSP